MRKKIVIGILTLVMAFSLAACSSEDNANNADNNSKVNGVTDNGNKTNNNNNATNNNNNATNNNKDNNSLGNDIKNGVDDLGNDIKDGIDDLDGNGNQNNR